MNVLQPLTFTVMAGIVSLPVHRQARFSSISPSSSDIVSTTFMQISSLPKLATQLSTDYFKIMFTKRFEGVKSESA
jgi:hypothetical protein